MNYFADVHLINPERSKRLDNLGCFVEFVKYFVGWEVGRTFGEVVFRK